MKHPSGIQIKHQRNKLTFPAQIDFVDGNMPNLLELERFALATQVTPVDIFDRISTETSQFRYVPDAGYLTQVYRKSFQWSGIVLLRFGKPKTRLLGSPAVPAMNSRNLYHQFHRMFSDRKHLESATFLPGPNDLTGITVWTPQSIGMNASVQHRLAVKKSVL